LNHSNRTGTASPQVGQFCIEESPNSPVGIGVRAIKFKQIHRIAIGVGDVIAASLIVGSRNVCGRTIVNHRIRDAESILAGQVLFP
jgi:hypothetical protein